MVRNISRQHLQERMRQPHPPTLIEISQREDYLRAHLPGAIHQSESEIADEMGTFASAVPDKSAEIILYGENELSFGPRRSARLLEAVGYTGVCLYLGGKDEWIRHGLRIESFYSRPLPPESLLPL